MVDDTISLELGLATDWCGYTWATADGWKHTCYLDDGHPGACICGDCEEGTHEEVGRD